LLSLSLIQEELILLSTLMRKIMLLAIGIIIIITAIIEAIIFLRIYRFPFVQYTVLGATHSLTHWIGWIGTIYIFIVAPVQPIIKRKASKYLRTSLNIHMIGNLLAVLLVSVHFAQQLTRPPSSFPELGTGVVLYAAMILLVATGTITYSGAMKKFSKQLRFLHASFALTFYIVIIVHILHGISII
jgi:hypothetical protein